MSAGKKPIIGLAGGIGAGKSAVARIFESLGVAVIDSDRLNHEQLADPEVKGILRQWWGESIFTESGEVDRKALADIVFGNSCLLKRLEDLVYPRINRRRDELLAGYQANPAVLAIVMDSPKLFEAGLDGLCDAVVFVDAERKIRLERLLRARGWSEEELLRRENLQKPLDSKKAGADYIIKNNSTVDTLRPNVEKILAAVLAPFDHAHEGGASAS